MRTAARLGTALGPIVALWSVMPVLLSRATPGSPAILLGLVGAAGVGAHLGSRLLSNRGWFVGDRSPLELTLGAVGVAVLLSATLAGVAAAGHESSVTADPIDLTMLAAVGAAMTILLISAFWGRVEFRGWILYHRDLRRMTRTFATAPIGPDRAVVHDLVDDLANASTQPGDIVRAATRVSLASDDRFRRAIPWSSAQPLLESFVEQVAQVADIALALDDCPGRDNTRVVLGPPCDLVYELALDRSVRTVGLSCGPTNGHGVALTITARLEPGRSDEPLVDPLTARSMGALPVSIRRPEPEVVVIEIEFRRSEPHYEPDAIEAFLRESSCMLAESPFSAGARRVYRRGDSVLKTQRHDISDPKPTLLEDEFHLLRRLRGRSSRFPTPTGYGIERSFSWIGYEYVDGQPLDAWLTANPDEARTRMLSFGLDVDEMLAQLAACRVAHRDLNPGNVIHEPDGGLVLIDFDQAARGSIYVGADLSGVDQGLAKNDLAEFLERAGLTRVANELLSALDEAWSEEIPFSLGVLGHRFGNGWQIDPFLDAARTRLRPVSDRRVLDLCSEAPILGLLLASAGAAVTAVVDDPSRWARLARLVGPGFTMIRDTTAALGPFDLVLGVGGCDSWPSWGPVVREYTGRTGESPPEDPWCLTTHLTQLTT